MPGPHRHPPIQPGDVFGTVRVISPAEELGAAEDGSRVFPSTRRWNVVCEVCGWQGTPVAYSLHAVGEGVGQAGAGCKACPMRKVAKEIPPDVVARRQLKAALARGSPETEARRQAARRLFAVGVSLAEIGRRLGVSHTTVRKYLRPTYAERHQ